MPIKILKYIYTTGYDIGAFLEILTGAFADANTAAQLAPEVPTPIPRHGCARNVILGS